jgi:hypothetical protein
MSTKNPRFSVNGDANQPDRTQADERKKQVILALDSRYKDLNKLWEEAEADLKQIPIPVDVPYRYKSNFADHPVGPGPQIHDYLGFVKSKGGWRICYGSLHDAFPEQDFDWKPITECTYDHRIQALPHIEKLREKVLKQAEECVVTLDKAIAHVRKTLTSWRSPSPPMEFGQ